MVWPKRGSAGVFRGCPCGGWGRHFSRAGETVAPSTDTRAHFSISTPHFLKSHQLLEQKLAADRNRQKGRSGRARRSAVRTRDRVAGAGFACSARPESPHHHLPLI